MMVPGSIRTCTRWVTPVASIASRGLCGRTYPRYRLDTGIVNIKGGKFASVPANHLDRKFSPDGPRRARMSDITHVLTHDWFLYLATVLDLFSCCIVGDSMDKAIDRQPVLKVLLMAVWRR